MAEPEGFISQNVFAAVRSDGAFSYVLAGAEGSFHDSTLCNIAFANGFRVPDGRYYLADAAFGGHQGIVVPFSNVRYHLEDWRNSDNPPQNSKELYNLRHARLRVVIEMVFGRLKRRWKIVRASAPEYSINTQIAILYAVTAIHNFVILEEEEEAVESSEEVKIYMDLAREQAARAIFGKSSRKIRKNVASTIWNQWQAANR